MSRRKQLTWLALAARRKEPSMLSSTKMRVHFTREKIQMKRKPDYGRRPLPIIKMLASK